MRKRDRAVLLGEDLDKKVQAYFAQDKRIW